MLPRVQILKRFLRILKGENLLIHNRLEINLMLREEITQILLVLRRTDGDAPDV